MDEDVFWIHVRDAAGTLHVLEKTHLQRGDRELTGTLMPSYASVLSAGGPDPRRVSRKPAGYTMSRVTLALCVSSLIVSGVVAQRGADLADALEKGEWPTYSGTFTSHRYSPLTQISPTNVASLRPVWMYQPSGPRPLERRRSS